MKYQINKNKISEDLKQAYKKTGQKWKRISEHDKRSQILYKIKPEEEKKTGKKRNSKAVGGWSETYVTGAAERIKNEAKNTF